MADQDIALKSEASAEIQTKAQQMGWIPPDRYKGNPERFTDAQEYLDRGEQVLPIVRASNKRLEQELQTQRAETEALKASLAAASTAIEEIQERHSVETVKAVEAARRDLQTRLKEASEAGDHAAIAEITGLMVDLKAVADEPKVEKKEEKAVLPAALSEEDAAELRAWNLENPWYGTDRRKTALALGIAQELREAGSKLKGRLFYDKIVEELNETLGTKRESTPKVEGARGSGDGGGGGGTRGPKAYSALPPEAKAACDADIPRFVGKDKKYKTAAEWQKRYADIYFEDQP